MAHLQIYQQRPLQLEPALFHQRVLDEQIELWWFRQPRQSLLCYCTSVALILGLGFGGVGLLFTTSSLSGEWRLAVGTALCLLSLVVLLKQLLSSAIQDMNCVRSRRRIDQLRSGGRADPALLLAVGSTVCLCGTVLLCLGSVHRDRDRRDMLLCGVGLLSAGAALTLAVGLFCIFMLFKRRQRTHRAHRVQTLSGQTVQVFSVSSRDMSSSRTSLI
ncbi:transmembrane protein 125 [Boleophthalmus pectinirostris]|uniref:transmembrane protein 125 n=1 Tax=Boleophthalmus pectinirostris TaxID=150288 RepID=UPI000A1C4FF6|nr:transmembrane protein 125 [Boleophthalmus pectinirostris]